MRTTIAATLLAAMPLFSQYDNPCISAEFPAYDYPTKPGRDQI